MKTNALFACPILLCALNSTMAANDRAAVVPSIPDNAISGEVPLVPRRKFGSVVDTAYSFQLNGKKVGDRWHYESGVLAQERIFDGEVRHGKTTEFYPNGQIFSEHPYDHGLRDGPCIYWTQEGKEIGRSLMRRGSGLLREFKPTGELARSCFYQNGKRHGRYTEWSVAVGNGKPRYETLSYENDIAQGWVIQYTHDHILVSEAMFQDGPLHGAIRSWNRVGVLIDGTPKYYIKGAGEVSKDAFERAAASDPVLRRSLNFISRVPAKKQQGK
jgi:antitoxin component YwqK of YwqJK toxin-antitoxin module